jgi:hypothetical protein
MKSANSSIGSTPSLSTSSVTSPRIVPISQGEKLGTTKNRPLPETPSGDEHQQGFPNWLHRRRPSLLATLAVPALKIAAFLKSPFGEWGKNRRGGDL